MFRSEFSGNIPFMNGIWPKEFKVSLEPAKAAVAEPNADLSDFGYLSLCFENHILAHIIATTLVPRKVSLSSILNRDVFVLYCLLKKYQINWVVRIREYMLESADDPNSTASLTYGLLISRIIVDSLVDLSKFKPVEIAATYDIRTFSSMGYVFVEKKWHKKESLKARIDTPKVSWVSIDSASLLLQEAEELKPCTATLESNLQVMLKNVSKIL